MADDPTRRQAIPTELGLDDETFARLEQALDTVTDVSAGEFGQRVAGGALAGLAEVGGALGAISGIESLRAGGVEAAEQLRSFRAPEVVTRENERFFNPDGSMNADAFNAVKLTGLIVDNLPFMAATIPAGGAATQIFKLAGASKSLAAMAGAGVGEGVLSGGMNFNSAYEEARKIPLEQLRGNPEFEAAINEIDPNLPASVREEAAREALARTTARMVGWSTGAAVSVLGAPSAAAIGKLMGGERGRNLASTIVKQVFLEGVVQEAPQSAIEYAVETAKLDQLRGEGEGTVSERIAKNFMSLGAAEAAFSGAIAGGVLGGAAGGLGHFAAPSPEDQEAEPSDPRQAPAVVDISQPAASVSPDEALDKADAAVAALSGQDPTVLPTPEVTSAQPAAEVTPEVSYAPTAQATAQPAAEAGEDQGTAPATPITFEQPGQPVEEQAEFAQAAGAPPPEVDSEAALKQLREDRKEVETRLGKPAREPNAEVDSATAFLSKTTGEGNSTKGINRDEAVAAGAVDPATFGGRGGNRLFTREGMSLDAAAEKLNEAGYPVPDQYRQDPNETTWTPNNLSTMLAREGDWRTAGLSEVDLTYTPAGMGRMAELADIGARETEIAQRVGETKSDITQGKEQALQAEAEGGLDAVVDLFNERTLAEGSPPGVSEMFSGMLDQVVDLNEEEDTLLALAAYAYEYDPDAVEGLMEVYFERGSQEDAQALLDGVWEIIQAQPEVEGAAETEAGPEQGEDAGTQEGVEDDAEEGGAEGTPEGAARPPDEEGPGQEVGPIIEPELEPAGKKPEAGVIEVTPEGAKVETAEKEEEEEPAEEPKAAEPEKKPEKKPKPVKPDFVPTEKQQTAFANKVAKQLVDDDKWRKSYGATLVAMMDEWSGDVPNPGYMATIYDGLYKQFEAMRETGTDRDVVLLDSLALEDAYNPAHPILTREWFDRLKSRVVTQDKKVEKNQLAEQYAKESRKALADKVRALRTAGNTRDYIRNYIHGWQSAVAGLRRSQVMGAEGTGQGYQEALRWIEENPKPTPRTRRKKEAKPEGEGKEIRRWQDVLAEVRKLTEDDIERVIRETKSLATMARQFDVQLDKDATPGARRYLTMMRRKYMNSFPSIVWSYIGGSTWWDGGYEEKMARHVRGIKKKLAQGESMPYTVEDLVKDLPALAEKWIEMAQSEARRFDGARTVEELAERGRQGIIGMRAYGGVTDPIEWTNTEYGGDSNRPYRWILSDERKALLDSAIDLDDFNVGHRSTRLFDTNKHKELWTGKTVYTLQEKEQEEDKKKQDIPHRPELAAIEFDGEVSFNTSDKAGTDLAGEDFKKFNFGGVEVGTYTGKQGDRLRDHVNFLWHSLHDMADAMGKKPGDMGMAGNLSLTAGALGQGFVTGKNTSAFYHPAYPFVTEESFKDQVEKIRDAKKRNVPLEQVFNPDELLQVINIINKTGDGSLAHEYHHALDFALRETPRSNQQHPGVAAMVQMLRYSMQTDPEAMLETLINSYYGTLDIDEDTKSFKVKDALGIAWNGEYYSGFDFEDRFKRLRSAYDKYVGGLRRALEGDAQAFDQFISEFGSQTDYFKDSKTMDFIMGKSDDPYWSNQEEMFARASEAAIADKLQEDGKVNTYLVNGVYTRAEGRDPDVYRAWSVFPEESEREQSNRLFAQFHEALKFTNNGVELPSQGWLPPSVVETLTTMLEEIESKGGVDNIILNLENAEKLAQENRDKFIKEKQEKEEQAASEEEQLWKDVADESEQQFEDPALKDPDDLTDDDIIALINDAAAGMDAEQQEVDRGTDPSRERRNGGSTGTGQDTQTSPGGRVERDGADAARTGDTAGSGEAGGTAVDGADAGRAGRKQPGRSGKRAAAAGRKSGGSGGGAVAGAGRDTAGEPAQPAAGGGRKLSGGAMEELGLTEEDADLEDAFAELFEEPTGGDIPGGTQNGDGSVTANVTIYPITDEQYAAWREKAVSAMVLLIERKKKTFQEAIQLTFRAGQHQGKNFLPHLVRLQKEYRKGEVPEITAVIEQARQALAERREALAPRDPKRERKTASALAAAQAEVRAQRQQESVYAPYTPGSSVRNAAPKAKEHPGALVESLAMSTTKLPDVDYEFGDMSSPYLYSGSSLQGFKKQKRKWDPIKTGDLSLTQLEAIMYAGATWEKYAPEGYRYGVMFGHGTGVGKGRIIGGLIKDQMAKGRKKHVWFSRNEDLYHAARNDSADIGLDPQKIVWGGPAKMREAMKAGKTLLPKDGGVLYVTYTGLSKNDIVTLLMNELGSDFDGVIAFDEAHNMAGATKKSATGLHGVELQELLPEARVAYVTATGATKVDHLAYAPRLGIWGEGRPFSDAKHFASTINAAVEQGGLGALEMIANDLKAAGRYLAPKLSFDDVRHDQMSVNLTAEHKAAWASFVQTWHETDRRLEEAIVRAGARNFGDTGKKWIMARMGQFQSIRQQFFSQIMTSIKAQSMIEHMQEVGGWDGERFAKDGPAFVIQMSKTNDAALKRATKDVDERELSADFAVSVDQMFIDFLNNNFPTGRLYPIRKTIRVKDDKGKVNLVEVDALDWDRTHDQIPELVDAKEALIDAISDVARFENPLDMVLNAFGHKNVAEVTGRGLRIENGKKISRNKKMGIKEADEFMDDKRRVLIFSEAGGTGASYHASNKRENQRQRIHYLLQASWQAPVEIQGLGRTHRTNQASAPVWVLMSTDVLAEQRFIGTITRRLNQLGALTGGQRQTGSQGTYDTDLDIYDKYAVQGLRKILENHEDSPFPGTSKTGHQLARILGYEVDRYNSKIYVSPNSSAASRLKKGVGTTTVPLESIMNRLLGGLTVDESNAIIKYWLEVRQAFVNKAIDQGTYDAGMENIDASSIRKIHEEVAHTTDDGLETRYVVLMTRTDIDLMTFKGFLAWMEESGFNKNVKFGVNKSNKRFYASVEDSGHNIRYISPSPQKVGTGRNKRYQGHHEGSPGWSHRFDRYHTVINPNDFDSRRDYLRHSATLWNKQVEDWRKKTGGYAEERIHMIAGAILPVWDRVAGTDSANLIRRAVIDKEAYESEPETIIGRMFPETIKGQEQLEETLKRLGAGGKVYTPGELIEKIEAGATVILSNADTIKIRSHDEGRAIALQTPDVGRYSNMGLIPSTAPDLLLISADEAIDAMARIVKRYPVADVVSDEDGQLDLEDAAEEAPEATETVIPTGDENADLIMTRMGPEDIPGWMLRQIDPKGEETIFWMVTGNTYKHKDAIKEGATYPHYKWWGEKTAWVFAGSHFDGVVEKVGPENFRSTPGEVAHSIEVRKATAMPHEAVLEETTRLSSQWPVRGITIAVARSQSEIPKHMRREDKIVAGAFEHGTGIIYVVSDGIENSQHLKEVLAEEMFGHYAMEVLMGGKFKPLLKQVWGAYRSDPRMRNIIAKYDFDVRTERDQLRAADEMIGLLARKAALDKPGKDTAMLKRIIAAVRRFFADMPVIGRYVAVKMNDAEILRLLRKARDEVLIPDVGPSKETVSHVAHALKSKKKLRHREVHDQQRTLYGVPEGQSDPVAVASPTANGLWTIYWAPAGKTLIEGPLRQETAQNEQLARRRMERRGLTVASRTKKYGPKPSTADLFYNYSIPDEQRLDLVLRTMQDRYRRLLIIQREIKKQGGVLDPDTDTYRAEERFHGLVFERIRAFEEKYLEPLLEEIGKSGLTIEEIDDFGYARHAPKRNEVMAERNPVLAEQVAREGLQLSGMTDEEAVQILDRFDAEGKTKALESIHKKWREMLEFQLEVMESEGLETKATINLLRKTYGDSYVPLKGLPEGDPRLPDDSGMGPMGSGYSVRHKEFRTAYGRVTRAQDLLLNSIAQVERTLIRAERNKVGKTFLKFVSANPDKALWEVNKVTGKPHFNKDGEVEYKPQRDRPDDAMVVKVNGKEHHIIIKDPLLRRAMLNLSARPTGKVVQALAFATRTLAALNTSFNPEFAPVNLMRDVQVAIANALDENLLDIYSLTEEQRNALADTKTLSLQIAKDVMPALWGGMRVMRGKKPSDLKGKTAEMARAFEEMREAGGKVEFYSLRNLDQQRRRVMHRIKVIQGSKAALTYDAVGDIVKMISDINSALENASRVATFKNLREAGVPAEVAGSIARNITVNFNRKGEFGNMMNALYMFFNASVQGSFRMLQALVSSKRVQKAAMGMVAGAALLNIMVRLMMGFDEEDGLWYYDKIPDWVKDHNLILPAGGQGDYIKIPLPYGYNVMAVAGNIVGDMMFGVKRPSEFPAQAVRLVTAFVDAFNPVGDTASLLQMISPTLLDPLVQIRTNENFFGAPIKPAKPTWAKYDVPNSQLYWSSVSPITREATRWLNEMTGGSEYRPGWIDISPEHLDHMLTFLGGGAFAFLFRGASTSVAAVSGDEVALRQVPFARRFAGETPEFVASTAYRERTQQVRAAILELRDARKAGNRDEVQRIIEEHRGLLKAEPAMKSAEKQLRALFKRRREVQESNLPPREKRERLKEIRERIETVQKRFIRRAEEVESSERNQ